jgi:hypothetical protein
MPAERLAEYDIAPVQPVPRPTIDTMTQAVTEGEPALVDGVYLQTWLIVDRDLEDAKKSASNAVLAKYDALVEALAGRYSSAERDSFTAQETAAKNYIAGNPSADDSMMLNNIKKSGETLESLAATIAAKATRLKYLTSKASGLKRTALDAIDNAATTADIRTALDTLRSDVDAAVAGFMQNDSMGPA